MLCSGPGCVSNRRLHGDQGLGLFESIQALAHSTAEAAPVHQVGFVGRAGRFY